MLLHFSTFDFIQVKFLFCYCLLTLLKINGINVIDTHQTKQKYTYVSSINSKSFNDRVSIINQASLIDRYSVLRLFFFFYETHGFQNLIKHNVIDLVMNREIYFKSLQDSEILSDESLGCILFVIKVDCFLRFQWFTVLGLKNVFTFLLTT